MTFISVFSFFIFLTITVAYSCKFKGKFDYIVFTLFVEIALILISTYRSENINDYANYAEAFLMGGSNHNEPGFEFLTKIIRANTDSFLFFLFLIASIAVTLNIIAISKFSNLIPLSLLIYVANNYILHDMIQIRCGIACGVFLFAVPFIYKRSFIKYFLIICICILFHYSSIAFLPLYFINSKKIRYKIYVSFIPIAFIACLFGLRIGNLAGLIPIPEFQALWRMYGNSLVNGVDISQINIFNFSILIRVILTIILLLNSSSLITYNKYFIIWVKIYTFSIIAFLICSDIPVIAFRVSELYQCIEFLLLPLIIYTIPRYYKPLRRFAGIAVALCLFYFNSKLIMQ